ncbi:MAG: T9SS type A sorting domain-containing protein [Candidatus Aegiribacteria sp.]|nr:T9SS type A sorting domain-containing protein [Candidatus Aegiribacteria sp.]MBD3295077.1 T9SS type A sorting domain-containing protein [Candidatus Fermentibacteria bacterium]
MTILLIALLAGPLRGPDTSVLSRPVAGRPYAGLTASFNGSHDYDVVKYKISAEVFPELEFLQCTTEVSFTSEIAGLDEIRLDLVDLTVDSVWAPSSGPLTFNQVEDSVFVELDSPIDPGDTTAVVLIYSGTPWNEGAGGFGGFWFKTYVFYHMGVGVYTDPPSLGRVIFPCWDHPSDKAAFEFHITVPDTLEAIANGDLVYKKDNPTDETTTYHWQQLQPMSTYLAAFSVSDYVTLEDSTYDWIKYYVYPWEVDDALGSFQNVDLMMDRFESVYSEYPWDTKFSFVQTPTGDMEHLTQVYHIAFAINGGTYYDWLLAHEMSHHWWGDCVTEAVWTDVWLSEGFAVYSEAVWAEYYGSSAYDDYVLNDIMIPYLNSGELFPLSNPTTPAEMWSYTTYQKGGSVLHMLRHVLGDADFYAALDEYFDHHAYNLATTDDLRDHVENITGEDIDWFFDTWVHDWGYPVYDLAYDWTQAGSDWEVTVDLEQVQSVGPVFTMPLEFLIEGTGDDTLVVMWNDQAVQSETFTVPFQPVGVQFDPGNYVLSTHLTGIEDQPNPADGYGVLNFAPNPASMSVDLLWSGMESSSLDVGLYDLSGRMLQKWTLAGGQRTLELSRIPAGLYLVEASGPGNIRQTSKLLIQRGQ